MARHGPPWPAGLVLQVIEQGVDGSRLVAAALGHVQQIGRRLASQGQNRPQGGWSPRIRGWSVAVGGAAPLALGVELWK